MSTLERKYALTKIAPGDYLLPSNDARTVWRIARYDERPEAALWAVWRWNADDLYSHDLGAAPVDPGDWSRWEMVDSGHETRADAIREAMRMG